MRSELTATIKRVQGMIDYVRENLDEGEYDLFLDLLVPEPEVEPAKAKRKRKSSKKSARASGMAAAINRSLTAQRGAITTTLTNDNSDGIEICQRPGCGLLPDVNEHHKTTDPLYHEFQSAQQAAGATGGD